MSNMPKYRYLIENIGWMSISNFGSKILVFLLVPFYTRVLTTGQYGEMDVFYTGVVLVSPLITCNVCESVMRYTLSDPETTKDTFSAGLAMTIFGSVLAFVLVLLAVCILPLKADQQGYLFFCSLLLFSTVWESLYSRFARGIGMVKDMAFEALLSSILLVVFSVLLMWIVPLGISGYFLALSLSRLIAGSLLAIRCKCWNYLIKVPRKRLFELIAYGWPLSVNSIGWWAEGVLSRYVTAFFLGFSASGLLAAACKVPSIPSAIQQVFLQAWQISSIKEYDPDDRGGFFSQIYNSMCLVSAVLVSTTIAVLPIISLVMFSESFYDAWRYVPPLMLGVLFTLLGSVLSGVFAAAGNSKPIATSALVSIGVCAIACFTLIPLFGLMGAAFCSPLTCASIWIMRLIQSRRYIRFKINWIQNGFCLAALVSQIIFALVIPLGACWYFVQAAILALLLVVSAKTLPIDKLLKVIGGGR